MESRSWGTWARLIPSRKWDKGRCWVGRAWGYPAEPKKVSLKDPKRWEEQYLHIQALAICPPSPYSLPPPSLGTQTNLSSSTHEISSAVLHGERIKYGTAHPGTARRVPRGSHPHSQRLWQGALLPLPGKQKWVLGHPAKCPLLRRGRGRQMEAPSKEWEERGRDGGKKIREGKGEQEQLPPQFLTIFLIEQVLDLFPQCVSDVYSGKPGIIIFCKIKKQLWTSAVKLKGTL